MRADITDSDQILKGAEEPLDIDPVVAIRNICGLARDANEAREIIACLGLVTDLDSIRALRRGATS